MPVSEGGDTCRHAAIGWASLVWSVLFCAVHVYWLAGGEAGMEGHPLSGPLRWIDVAAAVLSAVAVVLAALLMRDRAPLPGWMLLTSAWVACAALGLRGAQGVIVDLVTLVRRESVIPLALLFDPIFLIGGVLFGLLALSRTARPKT